MTRKPIHQRPKKPADTQAPPPLNNDAPSAVDHPVFAQPATTPDPDKFQVKHVSDNAAYQTIDALNKAHKLAPLPFPLPRGYSAAKPEPVLTLAQVLGNDNASVKRITKTGQIVFHSVGDTGSTRGPASQNEVADKMVSDFNEQNIADIPVFYFHLGDVIYSFGEAMYYYDQFYEPYRDYPAPILALAGNHDGMVAPGTSTPSLAAFLENFCQDHFVITPEAGGLSRTAQIQPGVFFTFEAPFVRILALYSNTLEDPGVIADDNIGNDQLKFLAAALKRVKDESYEGALIIAHHHPAFSSGSKHGWSVDMLAQIDQCCDDAGVWPHAVFSAHAHNYQRFTRYHGDMQIPYLVAGGGGHGLGRLSRGKNTPALRVPLTVQEADKDNDKVVLECYDDQDYGYLRVIVNEQTLLIEYHPASDGADAKTPDDAVTIDLKTHQFA